MAFTENWKSLAAAIMSSRTTFVAGMQRFEHGGGLSCKGATPAPLMVSPGCLIAAFEMPYSIPEMGFNHGSHAQCTESHDHLEPWFTGSKKTMEAFQDYDPSNRHRQHVRAKHFLDLLFKPR